MSRISSKPDEAARQAAWTRLRQAGAEAWLLGHSRAVEGLAAAMCEAAEARGLVVERSFALAGAVLHDVGRTQVQDVRHASLGAGWLRAEHADERLVRVVERHTGAGIDAHEAAALHLPVKDYTPRSLEERIVAHADNLYTGDRRLTMEQLHAKYQAKALPQAWAKIQALHRQLCDELGTDLERLQPLALPAA